MKRNLVALAIGACAFAATAQAAPLSSPLLDAGASATLVQWGGGPPPPPGWGPPPPPPRPYGYGPPPRPYGYGPPPRPYGYGPPPVGFSCATRRILCPLPSPRRLGTGCGCPTPYGMRPGRVVR